MSNDIYVLYGVIVIGYGSKDAVVPLAYFSSRKRAASYIKKATLKRPQNMRKFKTNSILRGYDSAFIEPKPDPIIVPLDPEI
jgi:hypothetical protein